MTTSNFLSFCKALNESISFDASGPPPIPFTDPFGSDALTGIIQRAAVNLPLAYQQGYSSPLVEQLPGLLLQLRNELQQQNPAANASDIAQAAADFLEPFLGAVYDQTVSEIRPQLCRFLAVISDLYRSFLSKQQRAHADIPLVEQLPPLATFANKADNGPFTIPADQVTKTIGKPIGVVSLPSSYRDHPVLWAALSHETGGHDVLHADTKLLPELRSGVAQLLPDEFQGQLWGYWMDEAASDVYGLLNIGPMFVFNLAAFFTALIHQGSGGQVALGTLRNQAIIDETGRLDVHPVDLLRVHLALGVIESSAKLSVTRRSDYIQAVGQLAQTCAANVTVVQFVQVSGRRLQVVQELPLADMQDTARRVGAFIASAKLDALGGFSIQDIETWDDTDEDTAQAVFNQFLANGSVSGLGDDAQLLSGATLALLQKPSLYDAVTRLLNAGLDDSFMNDPIFGRAQPHRIFFYPETHFRIHVERPVTAPVLAFSRGSAPNKVSSQTAEHHRRGSSKNKVTSTR